jgi:hypothetical protein
LARDKVSGKSSLVGGIHEWRLGAGFTSGRKQPKAFVNALESAVRPSCKKVQMSGRYVTKIVFPSIMLAAFSRKRLAMRDLARDIVLARRGRRKKSS